MGQRSSRREFLRGAGFGTLGFLVGGELLFLSPAQARAQGLPLRVLSAAEAQTLEQFAEILVPGSREAGIAHFIDHQLAAPEADQLLLIRYLGVEGPFLPFYRGGLAGLDAAAQHAHGKAYAQLDNDQQEALAGPLGQANPAGWEGPPAPFFFFVLRSDALDVVYGTVSGTESLGLPYMAHILPPSRWGEG